MEDTEAVCVNCLEQLETVCIECAECPRVVLCVPVSSLVCLTDCVGTVFWCRRRGRSTQEIPWVQNQSRFSCDYVCLRGLKTISSNKSTTVFGEWDIEDERKLLDALEQYGVGNWWVPRHTMNECSFCVLLGRTYRWKLEERHPPNACNIIVNIISTVWWTMGFCPRDVQSHVFLITRI